MTNAQNPTPETPFEPAKIPDGIVEIDGKNYRTNAKGSLVPVELVKAQDALQDETVRKMIGHGKALSEQIARFKAHTFNDIGAFEALLAQQYEAKIGGKKGNKTLFSYDGLYKVQVQIAEAFDFGPELQIAKELIDECLNEWAADSGPELRAIVTKAFNTDKEGQINRSEIFMLLNLDISDERWKRASRQSATPCAWSVPKPMSGFMSAPPRPLPGKPSPLISQRHRGRSSWRCQKTRSARQCGRASAPMQR